MTSFDDLLLREGRLVYRTKGTSMEPMLRQNRDLVIIEPPVSVLKKYDVALYRRGGQYVLHRVIGVKDGVYRIRGDNTFVVERVPFGQVIGVLTSFRRKDRLHTVSERGYRFYVRFWNAIYPLRAVWFRFVRGLKRLARALGLTPLLKRILRRN